MLFSGKVRHESLRSRLSYSLFAIEELEERLEDEESERASLVSRYSRQFERAKPPSGFLRRLIGRFDNRASYQPIRVGDE